MFVGEGAGILLSRCLSVSMSASLFVTFESLPGYLISTAYWQFLVFDLRFLSLRWLKTIFIPPTYEVCGGI